MSELPAYPDGKVYGPNPLHELRMMLVAGPDCSVQPLGRVFEEGTLVGFAMPYAQALAPGVLIGRENPNQRLKLSKEQKRSIIDKLRCLLDRLHAKGITHGDIKPANMLLYSNGEVRLCDWAVGSMTGDKFIPYMMTVNYVSPHRARYPLELITPAEDKYSLGMSIWEIWTDKVPFGDIDEEVLEQASLTGLLRPDINAVDDPTIAALITSYLDAGPPIKASLQTNRLCIQADFVATSCQANPKHVERRIVKCKACVEERSGHHPCDEPWIIPMSQPHFESSLCTGCEQV
ncbi:hypothetical protein M422DRAFT_169958 [Sphaerobolus stellatus SS14]|uniref:Protein kinase domain-containing protein n=1 Tax=Sphaerobolus stellatus (strain SS14) TaxID=990650 RepID=A0A0C9UK13_SPHS4|nr:hypothetical protein M422DRAFT_169958 [Sphaerobolus stellatus SS14]